MTQPLGWVDQIYDKAMVVDSTAVDTSEGTPPDAQLTPELVAAIAHSERCRHCGGRHVRSCPRVKRLDFHPNGALQRVDFWAEGKWSDEHVIWPEDEATTE